MLSTNNLPQANVSKTLNPGNQVVKINSVELAKGYQEGSYQVNLNMEGEDLGDDFEGFFIDNVSKSGDRYKGQVGRVRMSQYAYNNATTNSGVKIDRDQSILRGLQNLAKVSGVLSQLDAIEADTIEEYIPLASEVLAGGEYFKACIGGKEYLNKGGYTQHDLFLPGSKGGQYAFTAIDEDDSKLMQFDASKHIIKPTPAASVDGFEAAKKSQFAL